MADHGSHVVNGGTCPLCGKLRYMSRRDAKLMARKSNGVGVNAYRCGDYWHLGHLPVRVRQGKFRRDEI